MSSSGEKRMMKRSDFAQKLLDDLRLRKEQLSISQKGLPKDHYAYSNRGIKGSKETRAKTITFQDFNYGGTKSLTSGFEASNHQILPYGKSRNMEKIDLSKALAYALENAGKATRTDPSGTASIISFLHEVGKRSLGYGIEERRSMVQQQEPSSSNQQQQLPMIHVHIKEISKGTQKLNQIIKACSNGLGFRKGRYSIQCEEDLELEQSLRLLVDIQQASEYTTHKQRRNRIKLLEENDDDDEEEEEVSSNQKYKRIKEVAKADIEMRLLALKYKEDKNEKHRNQTRSCEDNTEQRSMKQQKGRIPNVVAKLMGLGEFPEDEKETKKNKSEESLTRHSRVMQDNENLVEMKTQRNSTSLDLVIHKETHTANDVNHKAKSQHTDGSNIKKRNKVSYKKDGETIKKNVIRRNSSPTTEEDKRKIVVRSQQKPLVHKLSTEKKLMLHNLEGGDQEKKSIEKEKFSRERPRTNGVMTNHTPKSSSSVDIQTKQPLTEKAKTLRKSFPQVKVAQKEVEREVHKAEILEKRNQDISNPKVAESCINSSEVSGVEVKSSNRNELEHKRGIKDDSILLIAAERVPCQAPPDNKHHEMDQQAPLSKPVENSDRLSKTVYKGTKEEVKEDISLSEKRLEHRKTETKETLSENESNLKKIVLKSQLFLDTAEALFKLKIPLNVLHDADLSNNYNQEDKNLILDCGYELMKRKGRFQELSVHPFVKAPISSSKVNSLDQLVSQLSKEFEKLRAYGKDCYTVSSLVEEDYTPKVLERDVHHKDPNLNSMWDMGWNDSMFAFIEKDDVVRDIEREVFSGLLEEITRDLICI